MPNKACGHPRVSQKSPPSLPRILFFFLGLLSTENVSSGQNERRQWFREGDQLSKPVNASINHSGGERDRAGEKERGREGKAGKEATSGRRLNIRARMTQITSHMKPHYSHKRRNYLIKQLITSTPFHTIWQID